jgi:hypothetical protein
MNSVAKRLQLKPDVVHHAQSQARPCHGEMSEDDAQRLARNRWLQPDRGDYLCSSPPKIAPLSPGRFLPARCRHSQFSSSFREHQSAMREGDGLEARSEPDDSPPARSVDNGPTA